MRTIRMRTTRRSLNMKAAQGKALADKDTALQDSIDTLNRNTGGIESINVTSNAADGYEDIISGLTGISGNTFFCGYFRRKTTTEDNSSVLWGLKINENFSHFFICEKNVFKYCTVTMGSVGTTRTIQFQ